MITLKYEIKLSKPIVDILTDSDNIYILTKSNLINIYTLNDINKKSFIEISTNPLAIIPNYLFTKDNSIYRLNRLNNFENENDFYDLVYFKKTEDLVLFSSYHGNYIFLGLKNKKILVYDRKFILLNTLYGCSNEILYITNFNSFVIVLCRLDSDIRLYDANHKGYIKFSSKVPLDYPQCSIFLNENQFLIGSDRGLSLYDKSSTIPLNFLKSEFSVLSIIKYKNMIVWGLKDGTVNFGSIVDEIKINYSFKMNGYINILNVIENKLLIGVSNEQRHGRWSVIKNGEVKVSIYDYDSDKS